MTQTRMSHIQPDNAALGAGSTSKHALSEADERIISDKSTRAAMKFLELNILETLQQYTGLPSQGTSWRKSPASCEVLLMILSLLGCYATLTARIQYM